MILAVVVVGFWIKGFPERTPRAAHSECSESAAFVMSQVFVRRELKAPKTAEFPYISDPSVSVSKIGKCRFTVAGYVDAQNGFGALIRSAYTVDVWTQNGKEWSATKAKLL